MVSSEAISNSSRAVAYLGDLDEFCDEGWSEKGGGFAYSSWISSILSSTGDLFEWEAQRTEGRIVARRGWKDNLVMETGGLERGMARNGKRRICRVIMMLVVIFNVWWRSSWV